MQFKVKHQRTADCVVAGFRMHKDGDGVGSLLLGLYDDDGHAPPRRGGRRASPPGAARSCSASSRPTSRTRSSDHPWREWAEAEAQAPADGAGRMPGAPSRWNAKKDLSWTPLRLELVAEVAYEQVQNGRFRHSARLLHWRPDRDPASCTYAQLEEVPPFELAAIFRSDRP